MANKLKAADEIGKFARMFGAMIEVADEIARVGSLEQAARESEAALQNAREHLDRVTQEIAHARAAVVAEQNKVTALEDDKRSVIAAAQAEAARQRAVGQQALEKAQAEAKAHIDQAQARAADILAKAEIDRVNAQAMLRAAADAQQAAEDQVNKKKRELADLEGKISKVREQVATFIGR